MGFGAGFWVLGFCSGFGAKVLGIWHRVLGVGFWIWPRVWGLGFWVSLSLLGLGFWDLGLGFWYLA